MFERYKDVTILQRDFFLMVKSDSSFLLVNYGIEVSFFFSVRKICKNSLLQAYGLCSIIVTFGLRLD